jgi:dihydrofolate reductase
LGCCACAGGTAACPYDVEPPELLPPPVLLVGEVHGSLGVGAALPVGSGAAVSVGVGVAASALRRSAPAEGLTLSNGTGSEEDDVVGDAEPEGEALDCRAQRALVTGSGEGDELVEGDALADCSAGTADGLSDGRPEALGPPPSPAKAVAATDASSATVAPVRAAVLRVISPPPSTSPSPGAPMQKPTKRLKPPGHSALSAYRWCPGTAAGCRAMADLIYSSITSLDGYIEDSGGEFDWAEPDVEVHAAVNDLERPVGTYLYGRRLYDTMVAWETMPVEGVAAVAVDYGEIWRAADKVVYSRTLTVPRSARTRIEAEFSPADVQRLKDEATGPLSVGGAELAAVAFRAGLVDEVRLFVNPVVVGGGKRALPDDTRVALELVDNRRFGNGVVLLRYRVR